MRVALFAWLAARAGGLLQATLHLRHIPRLDAGADAQQRRLLLLQRETVVPGRW